jgi:hypothetical protein
MAYRAKKTEHTGAKHGKGAYYGRKADAKQHSNKQRRKNAKKEVEEKGDEAIGDRPSNFERWYPELPEDD